MEETIGLRIATQEVVPGIICGNAKIRVEGFQAIYSKVIFLDMRPEKGEYEPLLGYITVEECGAAVDVIGRRWIPIEYMDAKFFSSGFWLLVVQPLIGAAAGGEPIFQLFLQRFDDCGSFGSKVN